MRSGSGQLNTLGDPLVLGTRSVDGLLVVVVVTVMSENSGPTGEKIRREITVYEVTLCRSVGRRSIFFSRAERAIGGCSERVRVC